MGKVSQYTKKVTNGVTAQQSKPLTADTLSVKLYQQITKLPLSNFIDCLVDNDLSALIISGVPSERELQEAWTEIYEQYVEAIGDNESRMHLQLLKEITILDNKLKIIQLLVYILSTPYRDESSKELIALLNRLCVTNLKFDSDAELQRAVNRSKSIKIKMDLKIAQLDDMQKKMSDKSQKPSREHFYSILITLSDHAKFDISDNISVFEFCQRMSRFNIYYEKLNLSHGRR